MAADVLRSLRRLAGARATRRSPPRPGTRLYDAAAVGILTRANTRPGTRGRQAVDASSYRSRRSREPTLSAREAAGHEVAGSRSKVATFYAADPPRRITIEGEGVTQRDVRRAGSYLYSVRELIGELRRFPGAAGQLGAGSAGGATGHRSPATRCWSQRTPRSSSPTRIDRAARSRCSTPGGAALAGAVVDRHRGGRDET